MGQTSEGDSHFLIWVTLIKIVALGSRSHTGQNGSHLAKWVKLRRVILEKGLEEEVKYISGEYWEF